MQEGLTPIETSGRSIELETALPQIVGLVMAVSLANACFIYLLDEKRNLLILRASSEPRKATKARVLMKPGERPRCSRSPVAGSSVKVFLEVHEDDACASLAIPLITTFGHLIGTLNVRYELSRSNRNRWPLLPALAQKVANAIENVDLCSTTSRYEWSITHVSDKLHDFSISDKLTGLSNFTSFHEAIDREMLRAVHYGQPLALVLFDIDRFHEVNDTYGHLSGDQALQAIASRLLETCYYSDVAFRYGGDEFGMLLPCMDANGARERAEEFREELENVGIVIGTSTRIWLELSSGIAVFDPERPIDKARFIELAEAALVEDKSASRSTQPRQLLMV